MHPRNLLTAAAVIGLCAALTPAAGALSRSGTGAATSTAPVTQTTTTPLRILVTNDDGVTAPGLAVLVDALQALPDVEVTVVAPATNQSGVGDKFSTTAVTAAPATTANGDAATSVTGTPSDAVLYAVKVAMPLPPHVVVSGTNFGQNLGDITTVSGTVGAARTANRLGIPGVAVSAGFGANLNASYVTGGSFAAGWVNYLRSTYLDESRVPQTVNANIPTCGAGALRGIVGVPLGRSSSVSGYTVTSGSVGNGVFQPTVATKNPLVNNVDCSTSSTAYDNDIDAFNLGFITVSLLNPDLQDQ